MNETSPGSTVWGLVSVPLSSTTRGGMLRNETGPLPGRTLALRGLVAMANLRSTDEPRGRASWRNGAMLALGVVTCGVWALVAAVSILLTAGGTITEGETPWALLAVWVFVVFAPAAWLGLARRGAWGWWAAGFPTAVALVLAGTFAVQLVTPKPAPHVETTLAAIEAGSAPDRVYYLGRSFNGWDLEDAGISPPGSETVVESDKSLDGDDILYVDYGSTCGFFAGTCGAQLELEIVRWNHPFAAVDKCRRQLPAVRGGAVAVETDYEVDIFTGDVAIRLEQITWEGLGKKIAAALREVGDKTAHEPIPEPTPASMASIDARCP